MIKHGVSIEMRTEVGWLSVDQEGKLCLEHIRDDV